MIRFWRAYDVRFLADDGGKFGLTGAYKNKPWTTGMLTANCADSYERDQLVAGSTKSASEAITDLVSQVYVGKMFKPGDRLEDTPAEFIKFKDNLAFYEARCREHLSTGEHSCGIWGYKRAVDLRRQGVYLPDYWERADAAQCTRLVYRPELKVLVSCIAAGKVVEGPYGYRAEFAYMDRIYLPMIPCGQNMPIRYTITDKQLSMRDDPELSIICSHKKEKIDNQREIPLDPQKVADALAAQFEVPATLCTPWDVLHNVVGDE